MKISYDVFNRTEPSEVYIAKPGQRLIGKLFGIQEDSAYCEINLNNTNTFEFTLDRDLSGEVNPFYDYVDVHYELYLKNIGWFKINEQPEINSDGIVETKTVRAESLEIELQQYDLFGFKVNTGDEDSWEMLATDNTYPIDEFTMFREQVKFYRDTTNLAELSAYFSDQGYSTVEDLEDCLYDYPGILTSWRVDFDYETIDADIADAVAELRGMGKTYDANMLESFIGVVTAKPAVLPLCAKYPVLRKYVHLVIDQTDPFDESITYTIQEVIDRELQRQNQLSFMWLVLNEHGWSVGYVDDKVDYFSPEYEDREYLQDRVGKFDVENQDVYSFLTQDAAQYYRCIFLFDTDNYKVNCYKVENIGKDTNIILSFHNIQNSVTRNSNQQIYTVFNVAGEDDLDLKEVNFGSHAIEDLSYFMNTDHFPQSLIDKYESWYSFRESKRPEYMQFSIDYRNQTDVCNEILERVPLDFVDTDQYSTFSNEELLNEKANLEAELRGYEALYVDDEGEFDIEIMRENSPIDYSNYIMLRDQVIPNIDIELSNREQESSDDEEEFLDGYKYDFYTYGESYGVLELENCLTTLNNQVISLERKHHNVPPEHGDEYGAKQYALYLKYTQAREECEDVLEGFQFSKLNGQNGKIPQLTDLINELIAGGYDHEPVDDSDEEAKEKYQLYLKYVKERTRLQSALAGFQLKTTGTSYIGRRGEYNAAVANLNNIQSSMLNMRESVDKTNPSFEFTQDELDLLDKYYIYTDYENDNILTTDFDTNEQIVGAAYSLYEDAIEELYAVSHPQWSWQTTQDNLLLIPEFQGWHEPLDVGNFVRVTMREESFKDSLQVKLRVTKIGFNPFLLTQTIDLDFSNMTRYRSKRNDFVEILDIADTNGKNKISSKAGTTSSRDVVNVDSSLISKILNNSTFSGYMNGIASNITDQSIGAVSASIGGIVANKIAAAEIDVGQIRGEEADFERVFADYMESNYMVTHTMRAVNADIENLTASILTIGDASGEIVRIVDGKVEAGTVKASTIIAGLVNPDIDADGYSLLADTGFIEYLNSGVIEVGEIDANKLKATLADITVAEIDQLSTNHAFIESLQAVSSSTATSVITDAYIYDAVAGKITVADLKAGDITISNSMRIKSENGNMIMNGNALQILGEDSQGRSYVGVQLGYATDGKPSLILRDESGATILTPSGITANAIANELIINDMVKEGTLSKSKLNFPIVETNPDGTIDITKIKDGTGGSFGVEYTRFKQEVSETFDSIAYHLTIETPNGKNLRGQNITLNAKLYYGSTDVTNQFGDSCFTWVRHSLDNSSDQYWNIAHSTGSKSLTLTGNDVVIEADFECRFNSDGIAVSSSTNGGE